LFGENKVQRNYVSKEFVTCSLIMSKNEPYAILEIYYLKQLQVQMVKVQ